MDIGQVGAGEEGRGGEGWGYIVNGTTDHATERTDTVQNWGGMLEAPQPRLPRMTLSGQSICGPIRPSGSFAQQDVTSASLWGKAGKRSVYLC